MLITFQNEELQQYSSIVHIRCVQQCNYWGTGVAGAEAALFSLVIGKVLPK